MSSAVSFVALTVALIALLRDTWEHRQSRSAGVQGLSFDAGGSIARNLHYQERPRRKFEPSVAAVGSGTRYDVRTYVWVDDQVELKWKHLRQDVDRFDNTTPRFGLKDAIEIYEDEAERVWFGISFIETSVSAVTNTNQVRTQYVRTNLGRIEVQVWKWYRFSELRKWWHRQQRFKFRGGGTPAPLGRWKRVATDNTRPEHFPVWDGLPS